MHLHAAFVSNIIDLMESFSFCVAEDISEIFFFLLSGTERLFRNLCVFLKQTQFLFPSGKYMFLRWMVNLYIYFAQGLLFVVGLRVVFLFGFFG